MGSIGVQRILPWLARLVFPPRPLTTFQMLAAFPSPKMGPRPYKMELFICSASASTSASCSHKTSFSFYVSLICPHPFTFRLHIQMYRTPYSAVVRTLTIMHNWLLSRNGQARNAIGDDR